jgi:hypothetical protein
MTRVKPLDQNELITVANTVAAQQAQAQGMAGAAGAGQAAATTPTTATAASPTTDTQTQRAALEQQLAQAQQQQALLLQQQAAAGQAAPATQTTAVPTTETSAVPAAATSVVGATQATDPSARAQGGAGTATASTAGVQIPSSQIAPRTSHDYWTKHMAQFSGKYLPDGPTMRPNCGPASTTMALRMIGLDVPGFSGQNSEAVLDKARVLATGKNDTSVGTTDTELENLITQSGAKWSESNSFDEIAGWVKQGIPVVLSGNPSKGWDSRYSKDQVYPFDGGHWVTVSGYDKASGYFIVNDPLSQIGPIYVSEQELKSYNQAHGQLGIAVFR